MIYLLINEIDRAEIQRITTEANECILVYNTYKHMYQETIGFAGLAGFILKILSFIISVIKFLIKFVTNVFNRNKTNTSSGGGGGGGSYTPQTTETQEKAIVALETMKVVHDAERKLSVDKEFFKQELDSLIDALNAQQNRSAKNIIEMHKSIVELDTAMSKYPHNYIIQLKLHARQYMGDIYYRTLVDTAEFSDSRTVDESKTILKQFLDETNKELLIAPKQIISIPLLDEIYNVFKDIYTKNKEGLDIDNNELIRMANSIKSTLSGVYKDGYKYLNINNNSFNLDTTSNHKLNITHERLLKERDTMLNEVKGIYNTEILDIDINHIFTNIMISLDKSKTKPLKTNQFIFESSSAMVADVLSNNKTTQGYYQAKQSSDIIKILSDMENTFIDMSKDIQKRLENKEEIPKVIVDSITLTLDVLITQANLYNILDVIVASGVRLQFEICYGFYMRQFVHSTKNSPQILQAVDNALSRLNKTK